MEKLALGVGIYEIGEVSRAEEYVAVQVAGRHGYDLILEDEYSDEQVYLVAKAYLNLEDIDLSTPEGLETSLKEQGYKVVDLLAWVETAEYRNL